MYKHKDKEGNEALLCDLELSHLENIIKYIERRAKEGVTVIEGGGYSWDVETMWCDENTIYGSRVKNKMNYKHYVHELKRRNEKILSKLEDRLPDSYDIRTKALELDEKEFDQWWWETVYKQ